MARAWQVPSLAMAYYVFRRARATAGEKVILPHGDDKFMRLCKETLAGLVDGRLPEDLGDLPETLDTGEGRTSGMSPVFFREQALQGR